MTSCSEKQMSHFFLEQKEGWIYPGPSWRSEEFLHRPAHQTQGSQSQCLWAPDTGKTAILFTAWLIWQTTQTVSRLLCFMFRLYINLSFDKIYQCNPMWNGKQTITMWISSAPIQHTSSPGPPAIPLAGRLASKALFLQASPQWSSSTSTSWFTEGTSLQASFPLSLSPLWSGSMLSLH